MKRRKLLSKAPMAAIALSFIGYRPIDKMQELTLKRKTHAKNCHCGICLQTSNYRHGNIMQKS